MVNSMTYQTVCTKQLLYTRRMIHNAIKNSITDEIGKDYKNVLFHLIIHIS